MPKYVVSDLATGPMIAGVRNPGAGGTITVDRLSASPFVAKGFLREWGDPIVKQEPAAEPDPQDPPFALEAPAPRRGRRPKEPGDGE